MLLVLCRVPAPLPHTFRRVWTYLQSNAPTRQPHGNRRGQPEQPHNLLAVLYLLLCLLSVSVRPSASLPVRLFCSFVCLSVCFCCCFSVLCSGKNFVHWLQTCFNCFVTECVEREECGGKRGISWRGYRIRMRFRCGFSSCHAKVKAKRVHKWPKAQTEERERPREAHSLAYFCFFFSFFFFSLFLFLWLSFRFQTKRTA